MVVIKKYIVLVAVLLLVITSGCRKSDAEAESEIKNTVRLYTTLLAEGYRELNMNALKQVATDKRAMKAYFHMAANGEGQVKMDPRLNKLEFLSVTHVSNDRAEAYAEEKWHYVYNSLVTGEKQYENNVSYRLTYHLIKQSERWLVDDIVIEQSNEGQGSGELPFVMRPPGT